MNLRPLVCAVAMSLLVAAPAYAAPEWSAPQQLDAGFSLQYSAVTTLPNVAITADGTALLSGYADGASHLVVRPRGGAPGAPQAIPAELTGGVFEDPAIAALDSGDSIFSDGFRLAFRPVGAASPISVLQNPGSEGFVVSGIDTAPTGEAFVTADDPVRVAFRPAGATALADIAGAQDFGPGRVLGVSLDPSGGGIVVWTNGNSVYQAVRAAGAASFSDATTLDNPAGLAPNKHKVRMAVSASGHAVLVWGAHPEPNPVEFSNPEIVATSRAPGGGFAAPHIIAHSGYDTDEPRAAISSSGAGLVTWEQQDTAVTIPVGKASFLSAGSFAGASDFAVRGIKGSASAGSDLAVFTERRVGDDLQGVLIRYSGAGGSLAAVEELALPLDPRPQISPVYLAVAGSPNGAFVTVQQDGVADAVGGFRTTVRVFEDLNPAPPGGGGTTPGAGATPAGTGPAPAAILPIVPRRLVVPAPIYSKTPSFQVSCPKAGSECQIALAIYNAFGAIPSAVRKKPRKATLLGSASARVKPGGSATAKVRFTKAGRKAAGGKRSVKVRVVITVRRGAERKRDVATFTIKPGKPPKQRR